MISSQVRLIKNSIIHKWKTSESIDELTTVKTCAIAARDIKMVYKSGFASFVALKGIDLKIPQGAIQLLMGPSGSGKTTLLSILAGILTPTSGSVHLLGKNITSMSGKELSKFRRERLGFIFQGFNLFPALTAAENVEVALNIKGIKGKPARQQSLELLDKVGLASKANSLPRNLSGGQKQRIAIARALAGNPQLIMADEPTAALDSHTGQVIIELLCQLAKQHGTTVVIVTHDARIKNFADYVTCMEDGLITTNPM